MKKKILTTIVILIIAFNSNIQAQIGLNFNIGSQPAWGPTGYDKVEYYYMPDIDAYYNVQKKQFITKDYI